MPHTHTQQKNILEATYFTTIIIDVKYPPKQNRKVVVGMFFFVFVSYELLVPHYVNIPAFDFQSDYKTRMISFRFGKLLSATIYNTNNKEIVESTSFHVMCIFIF